MMNYRRMGNRTEGFPAIIWFFGKYSNNFQAGAAMIALAAKALTSASQLARRQRVIARWPA